MLKLLLKTNLAMKLMNALNTKCSKVILSESKPVQNIASLQKFNQSILRDIDGQSLSLSNSHNIK